MRKGLTYLVVGAVVVLGCTGIAYGTVVKIPSLVNLAEPNPEADGMAILHYVEGEDKTIVQIVVSAFEPNRTFADGNQYTVEFESPSHAGGSVPTCDLETNDLGHGTLHVELPGDWSDSHLELFVDYGFADRVQLRAVGMNPGHD